MNLVTAYLKARLIQITFIGKWIILQQFQFQRKSVMTQECQAKLLPEKQNESINQVKEHDYSDGGVLYYIIIISLQTLRVYSKMIM